MAQLSELVAMFKKMQGANHQPGRFGVRTSSRAPAPSGFRRGAMGVLGAKTLQTRDSQAGLNKEMAMMESPVFRAFLQKLSPATPISDFLSRGGF